MVPLFLLLSAAEAKVTPGVNCEGAQKWTKEDLIIPNGPSGPTAFTEEELATVGADFQEVPLECFGITPLEPWQAGRVDGDLAGFKSASDIAAFVERTKSPFKSALRDTWRRWPSGEVAYVIDGQYGKYSRSVILAAIKYIEDNSCVEFKQRGSERDYVHISPDIGGGCYSFVAGSVGGRTGGKQQVSLDEGCIERGTITHELMHVLGFFHEQSRSDRDQWVRIQWENMAGWRPGLALSSQAAQVRDQLSKYEAYKMVKFTDGYDYGSILHYSPYAYSGNGRPTIVGLKPGSEAMGQRKVLSPKDMRKLNTLYNCKARPETGESVDPAPVVSSTCRDKPVFQWFCRAWLPSTFFGCDKSFVRKRCLKTCGAC